MKKKFYVRTFHEIGKFKKLYLIMRLSFIMLLVSSLSVIGNSYSQSTKFSFQLSNATVKDVFQEIERNSEFIIVYSDDMIDVTRKVSLKVADASVEKILDQILKVTNNGYEIKERQIVITKLKDLPLNVMTVQNERVLKGLVKTSDGSTLPGATVIEKGTNNGTITDFDGNFTLNVSKANAVIVFSFVGMSTIEMDYTGQTTMNVVMREDAIGLEEVVAIGYGVQKRKEITSSITNVQAEDFKQGAITSSPMQLVQGKVAGLAISRRNGGDPTSGVSVQLRGVSTVSGNLEPLVIVDGVPGGSLNSVSPEDIQSIDVLRDGSAAAIYGTRGTNGVIIITTKKGSSGQMKIEYSAYGTVDQMTKRPELLSASEYRDVAKEFKASGNNDKIGKANAMIDYGADTDWFEELTRTPISQVQYISLSGGNKTTTYMASLNYRDIDGIVERSYQKMLNSRMSLNHSAFDDKLKLAFNLSASTRKFSPVDYEIYRQGMTRNPTLPVFNTNGTYYETNGWEDYNPVGMVFQTDRDNQATELLGNTRISYEFLPGLTASVLGAVQKNNEFRGYYSYKGSSHSAQSGYNGRANREYMQWYDQTLETTLNYSKLLNDVHRVDIMGGYSYQDFTYEQFFAGNSNFITDQYTYNNLGAGDYLPQGNAVMSSYKNSSKLVAFIGRAIYSYQDKYLMTAGLRHEGSSKFGDNEKWSLFPSVSLGWRISEEGFMGDVDWIDDAKVRVGYGVTGNQGTSPYASLVRMRPGPRMLYNGKWIPGTEPASNPNPDLRWETKTEWNVGLDLTVFENRLSAHLDVYNRLTSDLIYTYNVPTPPNIFNQTTTNVGEIRNSGIELSLNAVAVKSGDFKWSVDFNISHNSNELVSLSSDAYPFNYQDIGNIGSPGLNATPSFRLEEGKPIGNMFGYKFAGFSPEGKWLVYNKAGAAIPVNAATYEDKDIIGNGLPKVYMGLGNTLKYKNWDMSVFFRGVFGYDILNTLGIFHQNESMLPLNVLRSSRDINLFDSQQYTSFYVEKGDFLKLDNVTLGYNFNVKGSKVFQKARIYASGLNLHTFTGYSGIDPELEINGLEPGTDSRRAYPRTTTYTLGINLIF